MSGNVDITGYAIVSDDDKIAGADGLTPASLRNPKDWELYQRAQELANLVVFARRSHELEPNIHKTPRLVVSREAGRDSSSARTVGGGTRGARPGRKSRRACCRAGAASRWAAARWCSISSS